MQTHSLLAALALTGVSALAQTLVIPATYTASEAASSTAYPWGRGTAQIRVQYVYDSTYFTSQSITFPVLINRVRWRANGGVTTAGYTYNNVSVQMSTAAVDYSTPSTTFASNHGPDLATVFTGSVVVASGAGTSPNNYYVDLPITPFLYDPNSGNDLVFDIAHDGTGATTTAGPALDCEFTAGTTLVSRIYNLTNFQAATGSIQQAVGPVIEVTYTPTTGLFASFSGTPTRGASPLLVQFTDQSFSSSPGGVTSWAWDFDGDGVTDSTLQNPSFVYGACGTYNVSLTVNDGAFPANTLTRTGYVVTDDVTPGFTYAAIAPGVVQFTDTSSPTPTSWAWDLDGDGVTDSTAQNPVFVYPNACASANVTLTVNRLCRGPFVLNRTVFASSSIETVRDGGTSISAGGGNYIDVNVTNPLGISVCRMEMKTTATSGAAVTFNVFITPNTYIGNENNAAAWRQIGTASTTGAANANDLELAQFSPALYLPPGTYGMHIQVIGGGPQYSTQTAPTVYSNSDIAITTGSSGVLGGAPIANRVWNGAFYYTDCSVSGDAGFTFFAPGCAGTQPIATQTATVLPRLGQTFTIAVDNLPLSVGIMVLGVSRTNSAYGPLPLDLNVVGAPGCSLHVSDNAKAIMIGASGTANWTLNIPNTTTLLCTQVFSQALVVDPGFNALGAVMSDAAAVIVGN